MSTNSESMNMSKNIPVPGSNITSKAIAYAIDLLLWTYLALVSHKIIYQKLIAGQRYPDFLWSETIWSVAIGAAIAALLFQSKLSIGRAVKGLLSIDKDQNIVLQPVGLLGLLHLTLTFIASIQVTQVSLTEFFSEAGLQGAQRIFTSLLNPNWDILVPALLAGIETVYMAFLATILALPFAFLLGFFAARNLMTNSPVTFVIYTVIRFFLNMSRSIEPLIWAIIFSVWVGIGPFAGMLALWLHSVSSLSKLYSEQIENIEDGPIEAMTATGAHPIQIIWFGVVPQIVLPYLSFTIYRWDINVRMATVIGLVGGGGIGTMLMQYQGLARWNEVGMLVLVIAFVVWVMDYLSSKIRAAIK